MELMIEWHDGKVDRMYNVPTSELEAIRRAMRKGKTWVRHYTYEEYGIGHPRTAMINFAHARDVRIYEDREES